MSEFFGDEREGAGHAGEGHESEVHQPDAADAAPTPPGGTDATPTPPDGTVATPPSAGPEGTATWPGAGPAWAAARPTTPGADTGAQSGPSTDEWPPTDPWRRDEDPRSVADGHASRRRQFVALGCAVALFGAAMGTAGYLIGEERTPTPASATSPFPNGFTPGTGGGSYRQLPGGFNFTFPGSSSNGGASTSSTAPAAVTRSEGALVDVNTTIDDGQASGAGTGIVLSSNGLVLTNNHVVNGATTISVTDLGNQRTYEANVVGYDVAKDVAVLQLVGASGLTTAVLAPTASQGETVYAVGNAGGTGGTPTVTSGTITGIDKQVTASDDFNGTSETLQGMLETSAALISGDSGGALTTASGEVVGVDTAGSSSPEGAQGGFAIPIATATAVVHEITSNATSSGVHVGETAMLGVDITTQSSASGAHVQSVVSGTPAAGAGITAGSQITSIDGETIADSASLRTTLLGLTVDQKVTVTWTDSSGVHHSATVTLASGPAQ